ncbi:SDR family oxidoreductase [Pullulanibacillus sp. KACC 23026]|uniref:SDR family oxidoreductase n=1 Tax=Pullulanibacillus sp. KACC 23026 TaxID=3028315 RepID=UPI0023AF8236|nr:SDR family oxidoreductase [Pullulanibacillus sp. KACC 23026]WEG10838.1 SDR family oxidoreductase [Pullulanibacillus sp. KACC 23026]
MDLGLSNKSVIVTAGSKGLGYATALEFAKEGAHVTIASRDAERIQSAKAAIEKETGNKQIEAVVCDMTDHQAILDLVEGVVKRHGTVDVLVNNSGGPKAGRFEDLTDEDFQTAFELNLLSFVRTIRAVLPYMKQQRSGHILNIASSSIKEPIASLLLSNTFRTGLVGLSKTLSQEFAPSNILINTIGPGRIATDRVRHLDEVIAKERQLDLGFIQKEQEARIPIGRYGQPDELARIAVFLCSEANTYMTGQALLVDGGMVKAL